MAEASAAEFFAERAAEYDSLIQRGAPRYGEMLDELVACVPADSARVLELGCGTGALTLRLVERCPNAEFIVVDAAQQMIEITQERLDERVASEFITSTFEDLDLRPQRYDCIVSSMALHHVADKESLYASLHSALTPGGIFAFADELVVADSSVQEQFWHRWVDFAERPDGLSAKEMQDIIEHMEAYDRYETLPRQMELLRKAGCETVDCVWRFLNYAVFVAS
jgi:trans-aconitate 2-methyltransferase